MSTKHPRHDDTGNVNDYWLPLLLVMVVCVVLLVFRDHTPTPEVEVEALRPPPALIDNGKKDGILPTR